MKLLFTCVIPGRPIVKKNTQRTFGSGRSTRRVSTPRYRLWESNAIAACNRANRGELITCEVYAKYYFHFENRMAEADVSNLCEAPGDLLKKIGVLLDDRLIVAMFSKKEFGLEPKTIIELYPATDAS